MSSSIRSGQSKNPPNGRRLQFAGTGSSGRLLALFVLGYPGGWLAWSAPLEALDVRHWHVGALRERHYAIWSIADEHGSHGPTSGVNYYIWGMHYTALIASLLEGLAESCANLRVTRIDGRSHRVIHEQRVRVDAMIAQAPDELC